MQIKSSETFQFSLVLRIKLVWNKVSRHVDSIDKDRLYIVCSSSMVKTTADAQAYVTSSVTEKPTLTPS
jgi:hypothetical protein